MTLANDLAKLLEGRNVTINVHNGTGDIRSGVEITQHNYGASTRRDVGVQQVCGYCGRPIRNESNQELGYHIRCQREYDQLCASAWELVEDEPLIEAASTPLQIAQPQAQSVELIWEHDDTSKYMSGERPYYVPLRQVARVVNRSR